MCFYGYPTGMKGYKLYDLQSKFFFISCDVVFHESICPFHFLPNSQSEPNPFPNLVLLISSPNIPIPFNSPLDSSHVSPILELANVPEFPQTNSVLPIPSNPNLVALPSVLRRSSRVVHPPSYLKDFHCHSLSHSSSLPSSTSYLYPISHNLCYQHLSPSYKQFILTVSSNLEPQFFHQAIKNPEWRAAMQDELAAMELNKTWSVVPLPHDKHAIGCKWVYKIKYNSNGSIERYKARLVAKGFTHQEGVDFSETFSPVAKLVTINIMLALAASQ